MSSLYASGTLVYLSYLRGTEGLVRPLYDLTYSLLNSYTGHPAQECGFDEQYLHCLSDNARALFLSCNSLISISIFVSDLNVSVICNGNIIDSLEGEGCDPLSLY